MFVNAKWNSKVLWGPVCSKPVQIKIMIFKNISRHPNTWFGCFCHLSNCQIQDQFWAVLDNMHAVFLFTLGHTKILEMSSLKPFIHIYSTLKKIRLLDICTVFVVFSSITAEETSFPFQHLIFHDLLRLSLTAGAACFHHPKASHIKNWSQPHYPTACVFHTHTRFFCVVRSLSAVTSWSALETL